MAVMPSKEESRKWEEIDSGPKLPSVVIDWAWRREAVKALIAGGWSLRDIASVVECSHEKVRELRDA